MDSTKTVPLSSQRVKGDGRHHLNLTWRQVFLYVQGSEGPSHCDMTWQESLELCGRVLGYDVMINPAQDGKEVSLIREGLESHAFTGDLALNGAYELLLGNLVFNAHYYPGETMSWSPEELNALCYGEKMFRELCDG